MIKLLIFIALAGAVGTLSRHGLHAAVGRIMGDDFPYGTFLVNVVGSFLFGLIWGIAESRMPEAGNARLILLAGFMGAFTTFSTFSFDTVRLLTDGRPALAMLNVAASVVIGVTALYIGLVIGERFG